MPSLARDAEPWPEAGREWADRGRAATGRPPVVNGLIARGNLRRCPARGRVRRGLALGCTLMRLPRGEIAPFISKILRSHVPLDTAVKKEILAEYAISEG